MRADDGKNQPIWGIRSLVRLAYRQFPHRRELGGGCFIPLSGQINS
jgi:hypothetical protein